MRPVGLASGLALGLMILWSGASAPSAQEVEVSVGIASASSDAPIFIGEKKGYFRDEGIKVKTITFSSATYMVAPLGTGQLDVGGGAPSAGLYNAVARGIKLKIVADKASSQPGYGVNRDPGPQRPCRRRTIQDAEGLEGHEARARRHRREQHDDAERDHQTARREVQ